MENNKIDGLQILRGFAALTVILTHNWSDIGGVIAKKLGFNLIGAVGVDIFFVLSGFIMSYTLSTVSVGGIGNAKKFFLKRTKRIYPIYLVVLFPLMAVAIFLHKAGWYDILGNILLLPTFNSNPDYRLFVPQAWTLVYEMIFYCVFAASIFLARNKKQVVILTSTIIIFSILITKFFTADPEKLHWVNFHFILSDTLMLNFVCGTIYGFIYPGLRNRFNIKNSVIIVLSILLFLYGFLLYKEGGNRFISLGISSVIIIILFSFYKVSETKVNSVLIFLGDASYSIYLTHIYFGFMASYLLKKIHINADLVGVLATILAIIFGCIFYQVLESRINAYMRAQNRSVARATNQD